MFEWQIKPLAKKSAGSEREIRTGDRVVCAVFADELGNLDRLDFLKDEFDASKIPGKPIGKWERIVSDDPDADERAAKKIALASSEDFFISLFDNAVEVEQTDAIKQIFALLLERKRIIRPLGRPSRGFQKYVHAATKREFDVPQKNIDEELILKIRTQLASIII
ncbi:MAG: hypothetical protein DBX55_10360 [Verrucomicrobia bacterium]|nr:MAG: hypothetical protein DBX55_10360 [Verrucomicrobiota bacterium]